MVVHLLVFVLSVFFLWLILKLYDVVLSRTFVFLKSFIVK
jgi:hypothetical protein